MGPRVLEDSASWVGNTQPENQVDDKRVDGDQYKWRIVWLNVIGLLYLHLSACYGLYLACTTAAWATVIYAYVLHMVAVLGEYGGSHRLWCHRSYKANTGVRIFLMLGHALAYEETVFSWVRDHRLHHKYSDTDADPYNRSRGFFFAHVGWLMVRKHPAVLQKGKLLDLSDLRQDPVIMFQERHKYVINPVVAFLIPLLLPVYLWSESWSCAWHVACTLRYVVHANGTWFVNSAAHSFGYRPYDKHIQPTENRLASFFTLGEGWHNFHHTFPWDYRSAELGNFRINFTTWFIDTCAKMGWTWDLKSVNQSIIEQRAKRTGDGTQGHSVWGWDDKDMTQDDRSMAVEYFKKTIS